MESPRTTSPTWRPASFSMRGQVRIAPTRCACTQDAWFDLGEVVVLGREPEDRNSVGAVARGFFRAADDRESFVKGVGRAGKESYLLAGDDGDGTRGQAIEIAGRDGIDLPPAPNCWFCSRRISTTARRTPGSRLHFARGGVNTSGRRRMRVIGRDAAKIVEKRGEKLGGVRDFTE